MVVAAGVARREDSVGASAAGVVDVGATEEEVSDVAAPNTEPPEDAVVLLVVVAVLAVLEALETPPNAAAGLEFSGEAAVLVGVTAVVLLGVVASLSNDKDLTTFDEVVVVDLLILPSGVVEDAVVEDTT